MSYCSLEEAYGKDFCNQVNDNYMLGYSAPYTTNKMNPTRNDMYIQGSRYGTEISRVKYSKDTQKNAIIQANQDIFTHRKSFDSISGVIPENKSVKTITPWGDEIDYNENEMINELSPREILKKSLLKDRVITNSNNKIENNDFIYEPQGFSNLNNYKTLENGICQNYFHHIDTCKKCQHRLKKRVIRYFKILNKNNKTPEESHLPGTSGMNTNYSFDRELFNDNINLNDQYEINKNTINLQKSELIENFSNFNNNNQYTKAFLLMIFGLFIIYVLDFSKKNKL